jgi:dipeptidyl aminopeptidase/acylaminoacyl peptidase
LTRAILAATALLVLAALVGCGGGDEGNSQEADVGSARVSWGEPEDGKPTALVMLIHGGGWRASESAYEEQKANAKNFQREGYATVAIDYAPGAQGFRQIEDVYGAARQRYPGLPICASGISAGGHLALMLAAREPDLTCVLTLVAPTDLTTLVAQDPEGDEAYNAAVRAFGNNGLAKFSPVRYADRIKAKVLMVVAEDDPVVPADQGRELAQALPSAQLIVLPPGPDQAQWAHFAGVQPDAQNLVIERDFDFLKEATSVSR